MGKKGKKNWWLTLVGVALITGTVSAQDDNRQAVEAPPPPPPLQSGDPLEPEVTIRRTQREVIYEYRQNGRLVLVRVQPVAGPPYHFVDTNGDGTLEYRPGDPIRHNINQWVLKRW